VGAPLAYLLTFTVGGTRLTGQPGSTHHQQNVFGSPRPQPNAGLAAFMAAALKDSPWYLDTEDRTLVLGAIREAACLRGWDLLAAHVRQDHLHLVCAGADPPEKMMHTLKAYATRALRRRRPERPAPWTRHGSTAYLWTPESVARSIAYVTEGQGELMAVFAGDEPPASGSEPRQ
jgi:REP element-mobilizing transposase RayT